MRFSSRAFVCSVVSPFAAALLGSLPHNRPPPADLDATLAELVRRTATP
ncbi:hypothetical protein [Streptomyces sp. TRM68367]|nr:hypothetical protein [Streptomyces sp. TRM68367]